MIGRTFKLFISSSFQDMELERNAVHRSVIRELRERCLPHRWGVEAIDLRWGVGTASAYRHETIDVCLSELARCKQSSPDAYFVGLLGNRYGWQPLPPRIGRSRMEELIPFMTDDEARALVFRESESHVPHGAGNGWYRLDHNAYSPTYVLLPRIEGSEFYPPEAWAAEERKLLRILRTVESRKGDPVEEDRPSILSRSATHLEMEHGLLSGTSAPGSGFCWIRRMTPTPTRSQTHPLSEGDARIYFDTDPITGGLCHDSIARQEALLQRVRDALPPHCLGETQVDLHDPERSLERAAGEMSTFLVEAIWSRLREAMGKRLQVYELNPEARVQQDSVKRSFYDSIQLSEAEEAVEAFIDLGNNGLRLRFADDDPPPIEKERDRQFSQHADPPTGQGPFSESVLVIRGAMSAGKERLLSRAFMNAKTRHPDRHFIFRRIGLTPQSLTLRDLLTGLEEELRATVTAPVNERVPRASDRVRAFAPMADVAAGFQEAVTSSSAIQPVVVFIAGLERLEGEGALGSHDWLGMGRSWGRYQFIVSVTESGDHTKASLVAKLKARFPTAGFLHIGALEPETIERLVDRNLRARSSPRLLTDAQRSLVVTASHSYPFPGWIALASGVAAGWPSYYSPRELPKSADEIIHLSISQASHARTTGHFAKFALSALATSRLGLSPREVLSAAQNLPEYSNEFQAEAFHAAPAHGADHELPYALWARFSHDFESILTHTGAEGSQVRIASQAHSDAIKETLLAGPLRQSMHRSLAQCFRKQHTVEHHAAGADFNTRKMLEEPFHLLGCRDWVRLGSVRTGTYCDPEWLAAACQSGIALTVYEDLLTAIQQAKAVRERQHCGGADGSGAFHDPEPSPNEAAHAAAFEVRAQTIARFLREHTGSIARYPDLALSILANSIELEEMRDRAKACFSKGRSVTLWRKASPLSTGATEILLSHHERLFEGISVFSEISPDGQTAVFFGTSRDSKTVLVPMDLPKQLLALSEDARAACFHGQSTQVLLASRQLCSYDVASGRKIIQYDVHDADIASMTVLESQQVLVYTTKDGGLHWIDLRGEQPSAPICDVAGEALSLASHEESGIVACLFEGGLLKVIDCSGPTPKHVAIQQLPQSVTAIEWISRTTIAGCGDDFSVLLWDWASARNAGSLKNLAAKSRRFGETLCIMAASLDGAILAAGNRMGEVLAWSLKDRKLKAKIKAHAGEVLSIRISPDKGTLRTTSTQGDLRSWNLAALLDGEIFEEKPHASHAVAVNSSGTKAVADGGSRALTIYTIADSISKRQLDVFEAHGAAHDYGDVVRVEWIAGTDSFAYLTQGGFVGRWCLREEREVDFGRLPSGYVSFSSSAPESSLAAIILSSVGPADDQAVVLFDLQDCTVPEAFGIDRSDYIADSVAINQSGDTMAIGMRRLPGLDDFLLVLRHLATSSTPTVLAESSKAISPLAFLDRRRLLVTASGAMLQLWDLTSGEATELTGKEGLTGHRGNVTSAVFGANGRLLASASADHTLRLWDLQSLEELAVYCAGSPIASVTWNEAKDLIVCSCSDGQVHFIEPTYDEPYRS